MTKSILRDLIGERAGRALEGSFGRFVRTAEVPENMEAAIGVAAQAFAVIFGLLEEGQSFHLNGVTYERDIGVLWLRTEAPDGLASPWIEVYRPDDAELPGEAEGDE